MYIPTDLGCQHWSNATKTVQEKTKMKLYNSLPVSKKYYQVISSDHCTTSLGKWIRNLPVTQYPGPLENKLVTALKFSSPFILSPPKWYRGISAFCIYKKLGTELTILVPSIVFFLSIT